jgi:hypothetical protein
MKDMAVILFALAILALIFVAAPLILIWSLNTLFPILAIPYNIATWFAALWVGAVFSGGLVSARFKK